MSLHSWPASELDRRPESVRRESLLAREFITTRCTYTSFISIFITSVIFIHNQNTTKFYQESSPGVNGLAPHQNSHGPTIPPNHATFSRGKLPSLLLMDESPRHLVKEISSHFQVEWVVLGMWAREWRSITCFIDVLLVGGAGLLDVTEIRRSKEKR